MIGEMFSNRIEGMRWKRGDVEERDWDNRWDRLQKENNSISDYLRMIEQV